MGSVVIPETKRWTTKRKSALVLEIVQGKTTVAEASRTYGLFPSEIEGWAEEAKAGMENALRAKPRDVREQYERQLKERQEVYGEALLVSEPEKSCCLCWARKNNDIGFRPRIKALTSVAQTPKERWSTDLLFTSRHYYTSLVRSYGLQQEFITPHCPQQNGLVERLVRMIKEQ